MLAYLTGEHRPSNARPVLQSVRPTAPISGTHRPLPGLLLSGQHRYVEAITASANNAQQHSPVLAPAVEPPPHPDHTTSNHAAKTASFDRVAVIDRLMTLVQDRTGYPRDVLGMDQNLEADLGIDSIKRVEIIGARSSRIRGRPQSLPSRFGWIWSRSQSQSV
jgi:hypothetical protein